MLPKAPVPVFQHESELERLLEIYRELEPKHVLEVGTYHGGTLWHFLQNATRGATVVSIDSYGGDSISSLPPVDNRSLYPEWVPLGVDLIVIAGFSQEQRVIERAKENAPFDFLFIDGDHTYRGAKADWNNFLPLMSSQSVVSFHDIDCDRVVWNAFGVPQLWQEIREQGYVTEEIIEDLVNNWGGIGVVYL